MFVLGNLNLYFGSLGGVVINNFILIRKFLYCLMVEGKCWMLLEGCFDWVESEVVFSNSSKKNISFFIFVLCYFLKCKDMKIICLL